MNENVNDLVDYFGTPLRREEADVLMSLYEQVEEIPVLRGYFDYGLEIQEGHVIQLKIREKKISSLPANIGNLLYITHLDLSNNLLADLPKSIGNLNSMTVLQLNDNKLTSVPDSFRNLNSLKILNLSGNEFSLLPSNIGELVSLTNLDVSANQLSSLPASIGKLDSLTNLSVSMNQLISFPASFQNLKSLKVLNLGYNRFTSLGSLPSNLPLLSKLNCNCNQLTTLLDFPQNVPNLQKISLSENALTSLQGLPSSVHMSYAYFEVRTDVRIDATNNYLENLAGIPAILIGKQSKPMLYQGHDPEGIFYLSGNPLRSFHGIPRTDLHAFTLHSHFPDELNANNRDVTVASQARLANKPTRHEEVEVICSATSFHLSHNGADLLRNFKREIYRIKNPNANRNLEIYDWYRSITPENAHESYQQALEALFEYYRMSPFELAQQYLVHLTSGSSEEGDMSQEAIDRLKYEGSIAERKLLESNVPNPQNDPVIQAIQIRLSVNLAESRMLLL